MRNGTPRLTASSSGSGSASVSLLTTPLLTATASGAPSSPTITALQAYVDARSGITEKAKISVRDLNFYYGGFHALKHINLDLPEKKVTAFIGPSGCGKSTVLRTLNRMHEVIPGAYAKGRVALDGVDLYGPGVDPVAVRRLAQLATAHTRIM